MSLLVFLYLTMTDLFTSGVSLADIYFLLSNCTVYVLTELSGIPNLITADMIKEGAAVIDVGINRVQDPVTGKSRLVGDVDFEGKGGRRARLYVSAWTSLVSLVSVTLFLFLSILRREAEGRLHHTSTWRCGTHDCGNAHEEHYQSSEERSAVPPREGPHGSCVLMGRRKATVTHSSPFNTATPIIFYLERPDELPLHTDWKDDSFKALFPLTAQPVQPFETVTFTHAAACLM